MRILLVEDEPGIRDAFAVFLRLAGHEVEVAETVTVATATLQTEVFDVVVSDWQLPDGTSEDVFCQTGDAYRLVVSGHGDLLEGRSRAERILSKPLHPRVLVEILEERQAQIEADQRSVRLAPEVLAARDLFRVSCVPGTFTSQGDGHVVQFEGELADEELLGRRTWHSGGDLRLERKDGTVRAVWRLRCDGAPEGAVTVRVDRLSERRDEIDARAVHIDATGVPIDVESFDRFVCEMEILRGRGAALSIGSLPRTWFQWLLASDKWQELPMTARTGPDLPDELSILWDDDGATERDERAERGHPGSAIASA